jgi:hypothetical protein
VVLARFEQSYRDIGVAITLRSLLQRRAPGDPPALVPFIAGPATLADLTSVSRVAVEDLADVRHEHQLTLNPTFAQSHALGGADADAIVDGLLLDWKTGGATKTVSRRELWQLLGYVFADTDDTYEIDRVGISAVRWRRRVSWPVEELLALLAPGEVPPLPVLRERFATVLGAVGSPAADETSIQGSSM